MLILPQEGTHRVSMLPKTQNATSKVTVTEHTDDTPDEYSLSIDCVTTPHSKPMVVTVDIDNTQVQMEVDTEAKLSLMSYTTFSTLWPQSNTHHPELKPSGTKLHIQEKRSQSKGKQMSQSGTKSRKRVWQS